MKDTKRLSTMKFSGELKEEEGEDAEGKGGEG